MLYVLCMLLSFLLPFSLCTSFRFLSRNGTQTNGKQLFTPFPRLLWKVEKGNNHIQSWLAWLLYGFPAYFTLVVSRSAIFPAIALPLCFQGAFPILYGDRLRVPGLALFNFRLYGNTYDCICQHIFHNIFRFSVLHNSSRLFLCTINNRLFKLLFVVHAR